MKIKLELNSDEVLVFNDEYELELLYLKYRPDILFKGADYVNREIVGSDYAKRIELIPLYSDWSSTKLIDHLMKVKGEL